MKHLIMSLLLLTGVAANAQESILDLAEGYEYELSIPFPGDTIVHIDDVDLPTEMGLSTPNNTIEDQDGISSKSTTSSSGESHTTFGMGGERQQLFQDCKQVEYESINSPSGSQGCSNQYL